MIIILIIFFLWGGYIVTGNNYLFIFLKKFNYIMMLKVPLYPWSSYEGHVYEWITMIALQIASMQIACEIIFWDTSI